MKIVFFSYFFEPDLSAGAFRAKSLTESLSNIKNDINEIHVITTHPNRYASFKAESNDTSVESNVVIRRISVRQHASSITGQFYSFFTYFLKSYLIVRKIDPDLMICTTSRHMTGLMTAIFSLMFKKKIFY